ncbi:MAG TPA: TIGR03618 family F420-dependent PPOX class oxidoreductase [Candidatus Dormibacteraeota bacterium]|nr:TIGR03618 family F420-dependent PPOX class oxidoreductase [Candidatus Dormibacteraeota bacterium]
MSKTPPSVAVPAPFVDLFRGDAVAQLATLRADGTPHLTPVWVDLDDAGRVLINARVDRLKAGHMRAGREVAVCVVDPANSYRYVSITGVVEDATEAGALEHMDRLARRYLKVGRYPWAAAGERRQLFKIRPTRVITDSGEVDLPPPEF